MKEKNQAGTVKTHCCSSDSGRINHSENPAGVRATTECQAWDRAFCQLKRPLATRSSPIKVCIHVCVSTVLDLRFDDVPVNYAVINTLLRSGRSCY